MQIVVRPPEAD